MDFRIEIYECNKSHLHVEVQVSAASGIAIFRDLETFAQFIQGCQEYIYERNPPIPQSFLDAFKQEPQ